MPKVDLVRTTRQAVETNQHRLVVLRSNVGKVVLREIGGSGREGLIHVLMRVNNEIDGESAVIGLVVGIKDLSAVVDLGSMLLNRGEECLRMAVEEQWVELTRGRSLLADLQEISCRPILALQC